VTALAILPGLDGTGTLHAEFIAALGTMFDAAVVRYPHDRALGYAELEVLARAALPVSAPFVLLGESFSGPIALSIAADPPPNLIGLMLSTTFARFPLPMNAALAPLARRLAPVRAFPSPLLSWLLFGRWSSPARMGALRGALRSVTPEVLRTRAAAALRIDMRECLSAITVPVLYLRARHDRLLPASAGDCIGNAIRHCTVVDIDGPHLLLQTQAGRCADALQRLVMQVRPGQGAGPLRYPVPCRK
jgi:pimeloyl-[acyl-carrier protein] methyl ester esterase